MRVGVANIETEYWIALQVTPAWHLNAVPSWVQMADSPKHGEPSSCGGRPLDRCVEHDPPASSCVAAFGLVAWVLARGGRAIPPLLRLSWALAVGIVVGVWVVPTVTGRLYVSLLNTFAALVLPGVANGYMIFLLKGFFDSIPRQLYEAADIDGASEWTKFWGMTMSLSTPILAVMALGAFTGAYSAFMMALVVIPDEDMWTIMVWLFQLQHVSHQSVVYASLVIAAIPTFLMFVFCQGIIMKGIVVPVDK